jgi:ferritin-like metal-binding protein YciE
MTQVSRDTATSIFVTGLKNAHAMEQQALELMQRQVDRLEHYPEVAARLRSHIAETQGQQKRIAEILDTLGERPSGLKDAALAFMGNVAAIAHAPMQDEVLKNSLANHAFENYEIAAYTALIVMADAAGVPAAKAPLEQSLAEEQAMADWARQGLRDVVLRYMSLTDRHATAGR